MKKYLFGLITGFILSCTVVMAANYLYHADEVSYTPNSSEWNVTDVKGAIDDLYDKVSNNGAIYLGEFSSDTTLDVSKLKATSANDFVLVPVDTSFVDKPTWNNTVSEHFTVYHTMTTNYTSGSLTLSNTSLIITLPKDSINITGYFHWYRGDTGIPTFNYEHTYKSKLYYLGSVKSN